MMFDQLRAVSNALATFKAIPLTAISDSATRVALLEGIADLERAKDALSDAMVEDVRTDRYHREPSSLELVAEHEQRMRIFAGASTVEYSEGIA